jgi:glycosyltransferase involved in cell wall biosynthesis
VLNLARGLVRAAPGELSVEIVAPAQEPIEQELDPGVSLRGITVHPAGAAYGEGVAWELADIVSRADVVHVHQVFTRFGEAAALAARVFDRRLCITDHGGMTSPVGRRLGLVDLADATVAYSRFGASVLGPSPKVTVIEGGVDAGFFRPSTAPSIRDRLVFAGRIMAHKGIDALVQASPPGVRVVVVGTVVEHDYYELLRVIAKKRDVTFMLDATDEELREQYRRAIAIVLPSRHVDVRRRVHLVPELMGLTALEGMACGAPAVVTRTGGLPEYIHEGVTGFIVDDDSALAERLERLAADPKLVERMGRAAREAVCRAWDVTVSGRHLLRLYRSLLEA